MFDYFSWMNSGNADQKKKEKKKMLLLLGDVFPSGCHCSRSSQCSWLLGSRCGRRRAPALKRPSTPQPPKHWPRVSFPGRRPAPLKWTSTATQVSQPLQNLCYFSPLTLECHNQDLNNTNKDELHLSGFLDIAHSMWCYTVMKYRGREYNWVIICGISRVCYFPAVKSQNGCCEIA